MSRIKQREFNQILQALAKEAQQERDYRQSEVGRMEHEAAAQAAAAQHKAARRATLLANMGQTDGDSSSAAASSLTTMGVTAPPALPKGSSSSGFAALASIGCFADTDF